MIYTQVPEKLSYFKIFYLPRCLHIIYDQTGGPTLQGVNDLGPCVSFRSSWTTIPFPQYILATLTMSPFSPPTHPTLPTQGLCACGPFCLDSVFPHSCFSCQALAGNELRGVCPDRPSSGKLPCYTLCPSLPFILFDTLWETCRQCTYQSPLTVHSNYTSWGTSQVQWHVSHSLLASLPQYLECKMSSGCPYVRVH